MKDTIRKTATVEEKNVCKQHHLPIRDTLDLVGGKWKLHITHALADGPLRFKELQREIGDITARMLSKELKELEMNELISREVYATSPVSVEYRLTDYGRTLKPVVLALYSWGAKHRERILKGRKSNKSV
jgi:DNA-binding HxlR family transcriptional regulator